MNEEKKMPEDISDHDIIFECPECDKSLAIDELGAGLMITCPDCNARIQVPVPEHIDPPIEGDDEDREESDKILSLKHKVAGSQERMERLSESIEQLREKNTELEVLRQENLVRFEKFSEQMTLIQNAIDRMASLIEDVHTSNMKY